jgi:hypothetical protein
VQNPPPPPDCGEVAEYVPQYSDPDTQAGLLPDLTDDGLLGMLTVFDATPGQ